MLLPRVKVGEIPDKWIWFGVVKYPEWREEVQQRQCDEAYLFMLKLPSYGYHCPIEWDRKEWCQLVIFWHGWYGFKAQWMRDTKLGEVGING
jgi:hypothetical protein